MVLHRALSFARSAALLTQRQDRPWSIAEIQEGTKFPLNWGADALISAESVLAKFAFLAESGILKSAPDMVFILTTLAAAFIFMAKFRQFQFYGLMIDGVSDDLLLVTIEHMSAAALHSEHPPAKLARLIAAWMAKWTDYMAGKSYPSNSTDPSQSIDPVPEVDGSSENFTPFSDPDFHLDPSFWASFMYTLTSAPDGKRQSSHSAPSNPLLIIIALTDEQA